MAKLTTSDLTSLVNETSAVSTINNNFAAVETAMEKTLSRDGTTPNQMEATLDMNSNPIINLRTPVSDSEAVRKDYVDGLIEDIVEGSAETLDDLLDVIITSPTVGQVLSFNGTNWVNDGASASADLNALSDVVITSALAGQYLQYNGTNWVNVTEYVRDITKAPYNADNTGATSAVTAIQAAIDAGGLIYAPAGAYRIDSTININNPCTIVGEGDDKTGNAATGTRFNVHGDAVNAFHVKANNVFMEKFTIQGQGGTRNSANTNGRGIIVGTSDTAAATITTVASSTTITATSSIFTAADVGKYVRIVGAGSQGSSNNHYSYIVSQSGTTAVLNDAPTVSIVGTSMKYGINAFNFVGRDITVYNHGVGIEFRSHNRYKLNHCMILGYDAIWSNNDIAIDSGDSTIVHCHTTANSVAGVGIVHNSGGGLRISDTKLLTSFNAIKSTWVDGISGGFILTGNSIENVTGDCISINGDGGDAQINGLTMTGNWINGGTGQIKIADNIIVTDLNVVGNNIINGSASNMITIGALVNGFNVSANNMNGNSGTVTGILVNSGASNGILANNRIYNCTTRVTNNGTAVYKFDTLNNGIFDVTRLNVAAGSTSATAIGKTGDDNCGIYFPANDKVGVVTGGAERFRMTNTGMIIDPNGVSSDPAVTFHVRTGTDHNFRVSNTGEGVSVQVLNDAVNAYTDLDFTGRTVYFKHLGQTKLATTTAGLNVLSKDSTVTISIASPGVVTWASHGLSAGDMFYFTTTGALPTGISANTTYFVLATGLTANTFQFSATSGGSAVNTSGTQSGTQYASKLGTLTANTIELGHLSDTTLSRSAAGRVAVEGIDLALDTFLQAGTGAVTRTVQSKLRERVTPLDFGAVGDGVTDDTAAIQRGLDYLASISGDDIVYNDSKGFFASLDGCGKSYKVTTGLACNNTTYRGIIIENFKFVVAAGTWSETIPVIRSRFGARILVRDNYFDCHKLASAILFDSYGSFNTAEGNVIRRFTDYGIRVDESADFRINNNDIAKFTLGDAELGDPAQHTGIGIHVNTDDGKVFENSSRWCGVPLQIGTTVDVSATTVNTSTTVTMSSADVAKCTIGNKIIGGGIPSGATITDIPTSTTVTISAAATSSATATVTVVTKVAGTCLFFDNHTWNDDPVQGTYLTQLKVCPGSNNHTFSGHYWGNGHIDLYETGIRFFGNKWMDTTRVDYTAFAANYVSQSTEQSRVRLFASSTGQTALNQQFYMESEVVPTSTFNGSSITVDTTNGSTTVTTDATGMAYVSIRNQITGAGIPNNCIVEEILSATTFRITTAATATASGVTATIRIPLIDFYSYYDNTWNTTMASRSLTGTPNSFTGATRGTVKAMLHASAPDAIESFYRSGSNTVSKIAFANYSTTTLPFIGGYNDYLLSGQGTTNHWYVDDSGRFIIAYNITPISAPIVKYDAGTATPKLQVLGTSDDSSTQAIIRHSTGALGPRIVLAKSKSATIGAHSAVAASDVTGAIVAQGSDGTNFIENGKIEFSASGAISAGVVPGICTIYTANTSGVLTPAVTFGTSQAATFANGIKSTSTAAGIGYATGAGSTVTQATSKSTGVTLNRVCGAITMNNAALAAATSVGFTFTNSTIAATDVIIVNIKSGATTDSYTITVDAVAAGSCRIQLRNESGGSLSEAVVLNYAVIKAVTS